MIKNVPILAAVLFTLLGVVLASVGFYATNTLKFEEILSDGDKTFSNTNFDTERYSKYLELQEKNRFWANEIKRGGYILHFRHAQREKWRDASAFDAYELYKGLNPLEIESGQYRATCLTRRGIEEAKLIKEIMAIAEVKVSSILSSPSCRAWMTADHAFDQEYEIENSLLNRTAMMPEQHEEFDRKLRGVLMNLEIPSGSNVALTGHGATLNFSRTKVLDTVKPDAIKDREETGIYVIERVGDQLVLHYTFTSIRDLANVVLRLPLD